MATPASTIGSGSRQALVNDFVRRVRPLPCVRRVLIDETEPFLRIWTIMNAARFDRMARRPIYEAELQTRTAYPDPEVEFRLLNIDDYSGRPVEDLFPEEAVAVYGR